MLMDVCDDEQVDLVCDAESLKVVGVRQTDRHDRRGWQFDVDDDALDVGTEAFVVGDVASDEMRAVVRGDLEVDG